MYFGKIVNAGGARKDGDFGFIQCVTGEFSYNLFFHYNDILKASNLRKVLTSSKYLPISLVIFDVAEDRKHPGEMRAKNVALAYELKKEAMANRLTPEQRANSEVHSFLCDYFPSCVIRENEFDYFKDFSHGQTEQLFFQRYEEGAFKRTFLDAILEYYRTTDKLIWKDSYIKYMLRENDTQIKELAHALINKYKSVFELSLRFPALIRDEQVLLALNAKERSAIPFSIIQDSKDALLSTTTNATVLKYLVEHVTDEELIRNGKLLSLINDERASSIVSKIEWGSVDENYINRFGNMFSILNHYQHKNTIERLAEIMLTNPNARSNWWPIFGTNLKIRLLINLSAFASAPNTADVISHLITTHERHPIVAAMLCLFKASYNTSQRDKDEAFASAHGILIRSAVSAFELNDISDTFDALLSHCIGFKNDRVAEFCDARPWPQTEGMFCPEGKSRACARHKCGYFKECSYKRTPSKVENQYFADFLINLGLNPDLSLILPETKYPNKHPYRYPYLLNGFINQLIELKPHMRCRCGKVFHPKFDYAKKLDARVSPDIYSCPESDKNPNDHDKDIYLNFCLECHRIIDSRECKQVDTEGYRLCVYCGASKIYGRRFDKPHKCPSCGTIDEKFLTYKSDMIQCQNCNHNINGLTWELFPVAQPDPVHENYTTVETDELPF